MKLAENINRIHKHDPNFPHSILEKIQEFLSKLGGTVHRYETNAC